MGRKVLTGKDLLKKAKASGYLPGAHRERDVIKDIPKYVQKTLKDQNWALGRYVRYVWPGLWHLGRTLLTSLI